MTYSSSEWMRWDVHIHAPGTALNDQFGDDWDGFFAAIRDADPPVVTLGITDYCSVNTYEEFVERRDRDDLPNLELVMPNLEFRLTPQTADGRAINAHVLVSPEDPDHVERTKEALSRLTVKPRDEPIPCTRGGLIALGRMQIGAHADDSAAYVAGVNQFKVDVTPFLEWYDGEGWLRRNSLLGLAGGKDGIAGLRKDDSFRQRHDALVRRAHFLFSSQESDRAFFLGKRHGVNPETVERVYGSLKPCLHGSDAHDIASVLKPDLDRYCWIKSAPTFDGLRQVLYEPEGRVFIGQRPPHDPDPERVIERVEVADHNGWFSTEDVPLSSQLTCVIGEKGTGKTALADVVAAAAGAWARTGGTFLEKAEEHLQGATAKVLWRSGRRSVLPLSDLPGDGKAEVMYLSQQFVERLCSGDLLADELIQEVERVIFDHVPEADRLNAGSFEELRRLRTADFQDARSEIREELADLNEQVENAIKELATVPKRTEDVKKANSEIKRLEARVKAMVSKDAKATAQTVEKLQSELAQLQTQAGALKAKQTKAEGVRSKMKRAEGKFATWFSELRHDLLDIGVPQAQLETFRPVFRGDYRAALESVEAALKKGVRKIEGATQGDPAPGTIREVTKRLEAANKALKLDEERKKTVQKLLRDVSRFRSQRDQLSAELERLAKVRKESLPRLQERRFEQYFRYFELLARERTVLQELYAPLERELASRGSGEADLKFQVDTVVDVHGWASQGEDMLDLRRSGKFSHRGALEGVAEASLRDAWRSGDSGALKKGIQELIEGILETDLKDLIRTGYSKRHVADWVFSVDHIRIDYTLSYKGTELRYLSPGTRGIVLLILYLGVDRLDDRPLIIDQPEENLDNASIFDVLVDYFREAKQRRQVIIVTHNPNLVVNTDAEQVVVASAERTKSGLPVMSYTWGPLERQPHWTGKSIRDHVCAILEGGEAAFRMRERRYELRHAINVTGGGHVG